MDVTLLVWLNGLRSPAFDGFIGFMGDWGLYLLPLSMLIALRRGPRLAARHIRDGWLTFFLALTVSDTILKPLIARPRPSATEHVRDLIHVLGRVPPASSYAFPSGTAAACFASATFIWVCWGRGPGIIAMIVATIVSLSRVYAGIHWPSDIAGGAVLGAALAIALWRFYRWAE